MRTAHEWVEDFHAFWSDVVGQPHKMGELFRAIQSDAARSERERCAKLCDLLAHNYNCEATMWEKYVAESCAKHIRAIPDANTDGAGEGAA